MSLYAPINVLRRYLALHTCVAGKPVELRDDDRKLIGEIEQIEWRQEKLVLKGWCAADSLQLDCGDYPVEGRPSSPRPDVPARFGDSFDRFTGFTITASDGGTDAVLIASANGEKVTQDLERPSAGQMRRARFKAGLGFFATAMRCLPAAATWLRTGDPSARSRIKAELGFDTPVTFHRLQSTTYTEQPRHIASPAQPVSIVLPVYNAFDMLPDVLDRVLRHTRPPFHLIVVEDQSSDARVRPFLTKWVKDHNERVTLLLNDENLGFVGSMNRGFETALHREGHVISLNSDAFVPESWCERLLEPLLADPNVASVTAASNDAEIASVPTICNRLDLLPGQADRIDGLAQRLAPEQTTAEVPTGVGFCMALRREWLNKVPQFDTVFGRGYGEEVDWCQKTRALGAHHLVTAGLFVEHRGGQSFGSAEKLRRISENNAVITRRYPNYDAQVQEFLQTDPLVTARLILALGYLATRDETITLYLAHSLGGGAESYLTGCLQRDIARSGGAVVLRVGGPMAWQIDIVTASGTTSAATNELAEVRKLLALLPKMDIVYSCGVGAADPADLPDNLLSLLPPEGRLSVLFHDYFPVSPSYCLLRSDDRFAGVPQPDDPDTAHIYRHGSYRVPLAQWRSAWGRLMDACNEAVVFSEASAALVREAYPTLEDKLKCRPHTLHTPVQTIVPAKPSSPHTIGVLGNIGFQKGAKTLSDMSRFLTPKGAGVRVVIIGEFDLNFRIRPGLTVHGHYALSELDRLVQHYGIECWLLPSIWPETFSYVTHEALGTGMPVFSCDLGAQGAAVTAATNGHALQVDPTDAEAVLRSLCAAMGWDDPTRS